MIRQARNEVSFFDRVGDHEFGKKRNTLPDPRKVEKNAEAPYCDGAGDLDSGLSVRRLEYPRGARSVVAEGQARHPGKVSGTGHDIPSEKLRRRDQPAPEATELPHNKPVVVKAADPERKVGAGILHVLEGIGGAHHECEIRVAFPNEWKDPGCDLAAKLRTTQPEPA